MNGGIIGKSNFPAQSGIYTSDDYIARKDLRYRKLWAPTSTAGLTAINGAVAYYPDAGLFGGAISLTKTSTTYYNPHFYGSIGGTYNLNSAIFLLNVYLSPYFISKAEPSGTVFSFALGTGTTKHKDVYYPLSSLSSGWNQLRVRAVDFSSGSIETLGATTWLMFMFRLASTSTVFGHGNIYVDDVLYRAM